MPSPTQITVPALSRLVGTPDAPVILDVRMAEDVALDPRRLPASVPALAQRVTELVPRLSGRSVVVVCQRGAKLSEGAAALLRCAGVRAETLEGGFEAWSRGGQPLIDPAALPAPVAGGATLWVTRARPKIDRIACPWLIRRFIDPAARILFVAPGEVEAVAERFDATPFDVEGVRFSHRGPPHDQRCSFDAFLDDVALDTAPLRHLARIVRAADTDRLDAEPQAAGLLAVSLGLSRMIRDDLAQLEAAMPLYDALYRWCRDATDERHDWTPAGEPRR